MAVYFRPRRAMDDSLSLHIFLLHNNLIFLVSMLSAVILARELCPLCEKQLSYYYLWFLRMLTDYLLFSGSDTVKCTNTRAVISRLISSPLLVDIRHS